MKSCYELFGIECGPGWIDLYAPLIERCEKEGVTILQIKEKFGGLRFYVGAASDELHDAIEAACKRSYTVCERCGQPGRLYNDGWMQTLCVGHATVASKKTYAKTVEEASQEVVDAMKTAPRVKKS